MSGSRFRRWVLSAACGLVLVPAATAQEPAAPPAPEPPPPPTNGPPPPADAPTPPPTWHGHTYPTLPAAPPGAFPVAPTGGGYYTLLQLVQGTPGERPPRWPYPRSGAIMPPFFEFNFSYLDPIPFDQRAWAEKLKRIPVGDHWLFSTGGEARYRYNDEVNSQLTGKNDTFDLLRVRLYGDLWYEDWFRAYGEFVYGEIFNNDLPPLTRDVNRGDIQNLFFDLKLGELNGGNPVFVRFGQQELLYGSQRLVSPNDWANHRVRFQALKAFYRSAEWDADVFSGRPLAIGQNDIDAGDHNQWFSGVWVTRKPRPGTFIDFYYLNLDNTTPGAINGRFRSGKANISTFGGRYTGRADNGFLWDLEGALQIGRWADQWILANAVSTYLGWTWQNAPLAPTLWVGYDYASGDPDPNMTDGHRTFNQLFAFGHYYFGFLDYVGRQNIHDFTVQGYCYPMKWLTTGLQYHVFRLASPKDALYNAFGRPARQDRTGAAGSNVGEELDVVFNAHVTDRQDVFVSYSYFFPGPFVRATGPSNPGQALYVQYSWRW